MERKPVEHYLALEYPFTVVPDDGSYFVAFPDLPGCMTQVEDPADIAAMAEEIRTLWIEGEYEDGASIPEPASADGYSGKFVARVPKTLHRDLAVAARNEGMSLNAYVCYLLAERNMVAQLSSSLDEVTTHVATLSANSTYNVSSPAPDTDDKLTRPHLRMVYKAVAA